MIFRLQKKHQTIVLKTNLKSIISLGYENGLSFLFLKKYKYPQNLMDIGTGGGFPSVPLAFLLENTKIFAIDSTTKKINFIKKVKETFMLNIIEPMSARIEELPINFKESFDVVTTRALGSLPMVLEYAIPYLKVGGYFVAYKSLDSQQELDNSKNALKVLNTKLTDVLEYKLPLKTDFDRKILVFQKTKSVSKIYPRTNGIVKKNPL